MSGEKVDVGQLWASSPDNESHAASLIDHGTIRIVARYPFHTHEGETVWIVESMDYMSKLERTNEKSLRQYWHLVDKGKPSSEGPGPAPITDDGVEPWDA